MLLKLVLASTFLFLIHRVYRVVYMMGYHLHYNEHYPGNCEKIKGIRHGSEHFHMFQDGLTFITSGFKLEEVSKEMMEFIKRKNIIGRIYMLNFNNKNLAAEEIMITGSVGGFSVNTFHPHGISGWTDKSGMRTLFVVNHEKGGIDYVEKFIYLPQKKILQHTQRYRHDSMVMLNDVQATSENSFYYTNFGYGQSKIWNEIYLFAEIYQTKVGYCDGTNYKIVLEGMALSNGIAMSHNGRFVYIANAMQKEIVVATRKTNNDLEIKQAYKVNGIPDNIIVDVETENLYVGSHPIPHKIAGHLENPELISPSQILKLYVNVGNITKTREILYDDGDLISASTVAAVHKSKLLIGSIMDSPVVCDVNVPL